ncbi:hypothetical protein D3C85_1931750 [compost metagenome]
MSPPRLGTQVSGVVIRNVNVTNDIPTVSKPPMSPIRSLNIPNKVNEPIMMIKLPSK